MMNKRSFVFKVGLLTAGLGLVTAKAFCNGTVVGTIISDLEKHRENAVVSLKGVAGPVAPRTVIIEQHHLQFHPKVTTIPAGSTVIFTNHDKLYHNVFSISPANEFNIDTYDPGKPVRVKFDRVGVVNLLCKAHPEMSAWVVVTSNSYAAVSDKSGAFTIRDVPPGTYDVVTWSEKVRQTKVAKVTVSDGKSSHVDVTLGD